MLNRPIDHQEVQRALLSVLDYDSTVLNRDLEVKLRTVWTLPRSEQDRVVAIMRSPKLHSWITATYSSALFINGNSQGSKWQHSTSFICAKLTDSVEPVIKDTFENASTTLALAFFCDAHMGRDDPDRGLDGMMRSLLAQLLLSYPSFDLEVVQQINFIQCDDVDDLCNIFLTLIEQLPSDFVVFCIVDGINLYEESTLLREEARVVLQALIDLTEHTKEQGCVFRLLLMSPWNSRVLYREMLDQKADLLWMPARVPSQGGFTAMGWNAMIKSNIIPR